MPTYRLILIQCLGLYGPSSTRELTRRFPTKQQPYVRRALLLGAQDGVFYLSDDFEDERWRVEWSLVPSRCSPSVVQQRLVPEPTEKK